MEWFRLNYDVVNEIFHVFVSARAVLKLFGTDVAVAATIQMGTQIVGRQQPNSFPSSRCMAEHRWRAEYTWARTEWMSLDSMDSVTRCSECVCLCARILYRWALRVYMQCTYCSCVRRSMWMLMPLYVSVRTSVSTNFHTTIRKKSFFRKQTDSDGLCLRSRSNFHWYAPTDAMCRTSNFAVCSIFRESSASQSVGGVVSLLQLKRCAVYLGRIGAPSALSYQNVGFKTAQKQKWDYFAWDPNFIRSFPTSYHTHVCTYVHTVFRRSMLLKIDPSRLCRLVSPSLSYNSLSVSLTSSSASSSTLPLATSSSLVRTAHQNSAFIFAIA